MAKKKKLKWYFISQEIVDGDREYMNEFLEQFYSREEAVEAYKTDLDECGLDDNGETATTLNKVEEITAAEYRVLTRFI